MTTFLSYRAKWINNFIIFLKYFYYRLFLKWIKDSLILYYMTYITVLLIFKTPEATFKIFIIEMR